MYVPLTYQEIVATTLTPAQKTVRDARVKNEALTVVATTTAAVDIFKPSADAKRPHEKFIPAGLVIPANGYLVLASGDYGQSGILKAESEIAKKKRIGETLYNTVEKFDPPYPGNDLANAFRNGTTIQLSYQDIPGNTAKANAKTDYAGASSATINKGDVIINEIMWGYDRGLDNRAYTEGQWIELHNTTTAAISIDKQEWILSYGPTNSFANGIVVDQVSNNPASGYWEVPGQSGVSKPDPTVEQKKDVQLQTLDREVSDIISMSRVAGAADGTAKASWAMSIAPSTNFAAGSASRVGTPGAANSYDTSAMKAADQAAKDAQAAKDKAAADAAAASKAPAASPGDLMITEIMVASNDGRLPQWIEIANVSAAAVSLTGWSISIDNDPADTDVIAPSVNLKLGDVVIGADQVALVVSKTGRNSGMDTAGNARTKGDANAGEL